MTAPTPEALREVLVEAPVYGIIDPDYARVFTIARCIAWSEGYALMMHGSFTRDLDLLAVPWAETLCEPWHLVRRIAAATDLKFATEEPGQKPHGRFVWTLLFQKFGDPRFVDLSVLPVADATRAECDAPKGEVERLRSVLKRIAEQPDKFDRNGVSFGLAYAFDRTKIIASAALAQEARDDG